MGFPKKCIIIDIGYERIKIADVVRSNKDVKVLRCVSVDTPYGAIEDGVIFNVTEISNAIKGALPRLKTKTKDVVFTISSSKIITREVSFPDLSRKKLQSIVEMNAAEYFPVNLEEYIVDFTVIEKVDNGGEKSVMVSIIAALSSIVNEYATLASNCNLNIVGVDYSGNSLGNFAKHEKLEGANILLDIGSVSTMVTIIEDNTVKFSRNLLFGTKSVIDAIVENFDVTYEEALLISRERPLLNVQNDENPYLRNDVSDAMHEVLSGISRLVDYYTSRNEVEFNNIILVGGGATIFGIEEYIENYFSVTTKVLDKYNCVHKGSSTEFIRDQLFYSNVIGASFSDINLVPKIISSKGESKAQARVGVLLLILVVVAMGAIYYMKLTSVNKLQSQIDKLSSEIDESKKVMEIKSEWTELSELVTFRKDLMVNTGDISERFNSILEGMEKQIPNDVFVTNISDSGSSFTLSCVAKDKMTLAKFIESMKDLETYPFKDVYVPSISMEEVSGEESEEQGIETSNGQVTDTTYYSFQIILTY